MYGGVMSKAALTARRHCPVIVSFCGSDLLGENLQGVVRKLAVRYGVWCSRIAARNANGIVVKSKNLRDALPAGIDRRRVRIVPNGVDLNRFKPMDPRECRARVGWPEGRLHVLFPANAGSPVKRLWLAEAAIRQVAALGVPADLHLLQGLRHEEVPVWLNASDCLLLTSEHEGSPNIVKEALACNRPVVSVDVGDVAERLAGLDGCHLTQAKPEALASALKRVFESPRRVDARTRMQDLSLERVAGELRDFYQEILNSARQRPGGSYSSLYA